MCSSNDPPCSSNDPPSVPEGGAILARSSPFCPGGGREMRSWRAGQKRGRGERERAAWRERHMRGGEGGRRRGGAATGGRMYAEER